MAKYKIISEETIKNLIDFLDEVQFDAAGSNKKDDMHKVNFCNWAIQELLNSINVISTNIKKPTDNNKKSNKKTRQDYVDETFMDWNLPEMTDEEYEKLVDQFDAFLRAWEKKYYKDNPEKKPTEERPKTFRPELEDVVEYMSLDEIKEYLLDDPELTPEERFELYYDERDRILRKKELKKARPLNDILKDLGISLPPNKK